MPARPRLRAQPRVPRQRRPRVPRAAHVELRVRRGLAGLRGRGYARPVARITIDQFGAIEHLDLQLPRVAVLVGANASGKSSVLHAIHGVLGPLRDRKGAEAVGP
jgi:hypothetical protein